MKIAKMYPDACMPSRKNPTDAGLDLYAYFNKHTHPDGGTILKPNDIEVLETGITLEIPYNFVGLIWPKSRSDFLIGGGVIDSGYQGQILVKIINVSNKNLIITHGQAIAQLLIQPILIPEIIEVPISEIHRKKTERGATGGIVYQEYTEYNTLETFGEIR